MRALLPRHFGLTSLFFLRFDQEKAGADYVLTKELHLSRLHNPHGNDLREHYCRRWVSLRLIAEARAAAAPDGLVTLLDAQRSQYLGTDDEYLCLTLARAGAPDAPAMSVTVGPALRRQPTPASQIPDRPGAAAAPGE